MTVLEMSVGGTLLIAAILVLRRIALYRLPKWSFLLLWVVALFRLLIPFSVPSQFSIYTGAAGIAQILEPEEAPSEPDGEQPSVMLSPATVPGTFREDVWLPSDAPTAIESETVPVSPLTTIYLLGSTLCGLFFVIAYGVKIRCFKGAKPVVSDFLNQWQEEHPTLLPVQIKTCDAINSPMAYGLLWPVVLLPENTDWADENQLTYVLTHEYVHIRRGDLGWKLLLTAALCLHWFNPLVWLMYIRANQDLELACDETVVRILGLDNRKNYAYALLAAAESTFSPFCLTYTTKNHMEERIRAIMKMKKKSTAVIICAAVLVAGISAVFATSPKPTEARNMEDLPSAVMTNTTTTSAPASGKQDVSQAIPERVHPITSSTAPQTIPAAPGQNAEPVQQSVDTNVEPETDNTEPQQATQPESAASTLENRWGVPDGEIPMLAEFVVKDQEDGAKLGKYLEATHGLYPEDYTFGRSGTSGTAFVQVHYYETKARNERLIDGTYPVNSKGETYGSGLDSRIVGYDPDLIAVGATNGVSGYALRHELEWGGYPGEIHTPNDALAYMEWLETQPNPRLVPVYDVNRDNIVGYFEIYHGDSHKTSEDIEEELAMVEDQIRRNMGLSEEEIAKALEELKQSKGWN